MKLSFKASGDRKYKKHLPYFDDGSSQKWIDIQKGITEVWTQNNISTPTDRMATIKAPVNEDHLATFEAAVAEGRKDSERKILELSIGMVVGTLTEVTTTILLHRAL